MELETDWINYDAPAGQVSAYICRPAAAPGPVPGLIVIQEVWGVDDHITDLTGRFATAGYVAIAPDLYSAGGGRPPVLSYERVARTKAFLNSIPQAQWQEVLGDDQRRAEELGKLPDGDEVGETLGMLFSGIGRDPSANVANVRAAFAYLRAHPACAGSAVASVGYCMGGSISGLLACEEPELGAAVIYYGGSPEREQVAKIRCPIRGFYGEDDPRIVAGLPDFAKALEGEGVDHELRVYPDTGHAFFNDDRPSYRPAAARDAWARTLRFFADVLDPVAV
jgi:carboxymethylenebutenolidase